MLSGRFALDTSRWKKAREALLPLHSTPPSSPVRSPPHSTTVKPSSLNQLTEHLSRIYGESEFSYSQMQSRRECQLCKISKDETDKYELPTVRKYRALSSHPGLTPKVADPVLSDDPRAEENRWLLSYNCDRLLDQLQSILLLVNERQQMAREAAKRMAGKWQRTVEKFCRLALFAVLLQKAGREQIDVQSRLLIDGAQLCEMRTTFLAAVRRTLLEGDVAQIVHRAIRNLLRLHQTHKKLITKVDTYEPDKRLYDLADTYLINIRTPLYKKLSEKIDERKEWLEFVRDMFDDCKPKSYWWYSEQKTALIKWTCQHRVLKSGRDDKWSDELEAQMEYLVQLFKLKKKPWR